MRRDSTNLIEGRTVDGFHFVCRKTEIALNRSKVGEPAVTARSLLDN
jgi:hypothetical protein